MSRKNHTHYLLLWMTALLLIVCLPLEGQRNRAFTVVIDAGHGGHDSGAVGNGLREKDINLAVALRVGRLIKSKHPDVKVLYTREKDFFVTLMGRAEYANKNNADLFISIHVNSQERGHGGYGTETYVMGHERNSKNMAVVQRENAVILMEKDYRTVYKGFDPRSSESYIMFELMQNTYQDQSIKLAQQIQKGFVAKGRHDRGVKLGNLAVLVFSAMPSVLVELGFISNPAEARYLGSEAGRDELASAIARGFARYKEDYDRRSGKVSEPAPQAAEEEDKVEVEPEDKGISSVADMSDGKESIAPKGHAVKPDEGAHSAKKTYKIQILSSTTKLKNGDKRLKGYKVVIEQRGGRFFYLTGAVSSEDEARHLRKKVRKSFPDAYIVVYEAGKRVREIY
ncbi:N-acetylmuramoyl-L-alanine amidase family protein [Porphyromonas gingivalis]|uniref:N-acetylmuramoyl-L-alanine amidase family protein n=1 Tax=Porphyromonas gingivalis TaxID=837 RepID=UPI0002D4408C|nr:N-acetylmuramoyl-L-alanine amidase [Porphyromonas gingivalis]AUR47792.1 N-acetylmuramoyl-L-alanine amidase [Porphyromonas gingivalis]ERJ82007.1 N-acetylmuramoyl-L-alanine amidase [Porphyromonas gingivalis F0185]MDH7904314.1 N-acetylmuramoyl-L-alanine amidase [Porphyromonas gingivalis]PDP48978.1 N-acetylmuramoyl-L-alanine amidase [Porphyromonas gingivalis]